MGILNSADDRLRKLLASGGAICSTCAEKYQGTWPKNHVATFWSGTCYVCQHDHSVCDVYDYDWLGEDVSELREL